MIGFVKTLSLWVLKNAVQTRNGEAFRSFDTIRRRPGNQEHPRHQAAHSPMPLDLTLPFGCVLAGILLSPLLVSTCGNSSPTRRLRSSVAHRTISNWCVAWIL